MPTSCSSTACTSRTRRASSPTPTCNRRAGHLARGETITPDQYIYDFRSRRQRGDPNPHLWTDPLYAKRYGEIVARRALEGRPGQRRRLPRRTTSRLRRSASTSSSAIVRDGDRQRATREPQAADLSRLLPVLRPRVRVADHRRHPTVGLRRPDAAGGGRAHRSDQGGSTYRRSSARRSFRARCSSRSPARRAPQYVDDLRDDDLPGENGDPDHSLLRDHGDRLQDVHGRARWRHHAVRSTSTSRTCKAATPPTIDH